METGTRCPVAHQAGSSVKATGMVSKQTGRSFRLQQHTEDAEGNLLPETPPVPITECDLSGIADPSGSGTSQGRKALTAKAVEVTKPGKDASASGSGTPSFPLDGRTPAKGLGRRGN